MKVELSAEADEQAREIDAWWRENRRGAPNLFTDELDRALLALGEMPSLGVRYEAKSVRRLLLGRTHYHLYFVQEADVVYVVAVWSAFRPGAEVVDRPLESSLHEPDGQFVLAAVRVRMG